jgi:hypothetical protein
VRGFRLCKQQHWVTNAVVIGVTLRLVDSRQQLKRTPQTKEHEEECVFQRRRRNGIKVSAMDCLRGL